MIGEDGKADWEEIVDKRLVGRSSSGEVKLLADIAYKCLHKIPRKRPSIGDVNQAIARISRHRLLENDTFLPPGSDANGVLRRIENQQMELSNMATIKSHQPVKL